MAEAIASILVEQLATAAIETAIEHVRIPLDAKDEVKELGKIFRDLKLVLEDAEQKQYTKDGVKPWLDEFKEVAYDMEDVLDEWRTEVLRSKIEGTPPDEDDPRYIKMKEKVSSYCLCSPFSNCFKKGVLYYNIGSRVKEIRKTLDSICQRQKKFEFIKSQEPISDVYGISKHRETSSVLIDVSNMIPRDTDKEFIVKKLLGDESSQQENVKFDHRIISIIGLGGLGKTSLAQLIIKDDQVIAHFQNNIFWVCVSEPFDRTRIAKAIIDAAGESLPPNPEIWNSLHVKLCESVKGKLFLLVLDDMWTEDEVDLNPLMDLLQLGAQGSRILVTTRKQGVAKMMNSVPYLLGLLSDDECWSLLRRKAFVGTKINDNEVLNKIGFEIAKKCHGLPLTASILGGLLKNKQKNEMEWGSILDSEIWKLKKIEENYFSALLLSYYNLPSALKRCFSYCVVFPKDQIIEKHDLIKMWMAQGFLNSSPTGEKLDAESIGEQYFNHLAEGSFFHEFTKDDFDDESIKSCKMHDLVHDFTQFLTKKHNIGEHELESSSFPDTLMFEVKNLRSLLVSPNNQHHLLINDRLCHPTDFFHHLRCLRVLKLKKMDIEKLPSEIKELIHLRYLDLSSNESLIELPNSVCSLFNLQTLILKQCTRLDKLPRGIGKLINLKHLCLSYTADYLALPEEIGNLTSLQTLDKVNINDTGGGSKLRVLKDLNLLQGKVKITGLRNLRTANEASQAELKNKKGLCHLELAFNCEHDDDSDDDDDESGKTIDAPAVETMESVFGALQPHPNLKELIISGYGGPKIPFSWMASLTSLSNLTLKQCFNCTELRALALLPSLEYLKLEELNNIKRIGLESFGYGDGGSFNQLIFPKLKDLWMTYMEGLEEFDLGVVEGSVAAESKRGGGGEIIIMPSLIKINITFCPRLRTLRGLSKLQSLKQLFLTKLISFKEFKSGVGGDYAPIINMSSLQALVIIACPSSKSSSLKQLDLPNLTHLSISTSGLLSDQLPASSPNLTSLYITRAKHSLPPQGLGGLKKLQNLTFKRCSFLTCIPEDVRNLTALQTLEIEDCPWPPSKINPDCKPEQEDEEAWSIMSHIPKITIKQIFKDLVIGSLPIKTQMYQHELISTLTPTGTRQHSYTKSPF